MKIIFFATMAFACWAQAFVPNCNEKKISYQEIENIANSPEVTDINSFLKAIPPDSMQTFTFVTNSLSAQRGEGDSKVSEEWPRVIRTSMDGKLTITYTCNPDSPTHNGVEVMYFDEQTKQFKASSFKLKNPTGEGESQRIHRNPKSCVTCHAQSSFNGQPSMKPNWNEYFSWSDCVKDRGIQMYGANDDNMSRDVFRARIPTSDAKRPEGCNSTQDRASHEGQVASFEKFKEKQKDNPCYSSLPWPTEKDKKNSKWDLSKYPYSTDAQERIDGRQNYSLRTNFRITDTYSHLMSQRVAGIIEKSPNYEKMKYYLAMEAADCLEDKDIKNIKKLIPGIKIDEVFVGLKNKTRFWQHDPRKSAQIMYAYGKTIGMKDSDWSMEYNYDKDPVYQATMPHSKNDNTNGDYGIAMGTQGQIISALQKEDSSLVPADALSRGVADYFGEEFSCIDDMGGALKGSHVGKDTKFCKNLRIKNEKHLANIKTETQCADCATVAAPQNVMATVSVLGTQLSDIEIKAKAESAERGKHLVQKDKALCIRCHSRTEENLKKRPSGFMFIPNDKVSSAENEKALHELRERAKEPDFMKDLDFYLTGSKEMPVGANNLTDQDRRDVVNYIESLTK